VAIIVVVKHASMAVTGKQPPTDIPYRTPCEPTDLVLFRRFNALDQPRDGVDPRHLTLIGRDFICM
jgi:hypothetical protein